MPTMKERALALMRPMFDAAGRAQARFYGPRKTIPYVRIRTRPTAGRSSINRTARSQEHRVNITSGMGAYIPELYGPCSPKPHMFAAGMDGNDLIFGLWFGFGEIEEFTEIRINGKAVPAAVTVEEHKGTTGQAASAILSNLSGYTHTLVIDVNGTDRGVAYLALRVPPGAVDGFPKVSVKLKGNCDIEDTRTATTAYSDVPALCWRHWLKTVGAGPEFPVHDSSFEDLADFNEECPGVDWLALHNYSLLDFAKPTGANPLSRIYEVTTDNGLSGAGVPAWNSALGATTIDAGLIWTCRDGRRHVVGMATDVRADIDSWMESWRTLCGCMYIFGESGIEAIPDKVRATDHVFKYEDGQIQNDLALKQTRLKDRPTVVQVTYTNTNSEPWRDATARVAAAGVDTGATPERLSSIKVPGIHRKGQAIRLAIERLNAGTLTDLSFPLHVFDGGLKVRAGDVIEVTDPIGLTDKKMRVLDAQTSEPGRWLLDLWEYDPAVYSDHVETEPTFPDFDLSMGQDTQRIFHSQPVTPYAVGDIWVGGPTGDIKRCKTARTSGAYQAGDWELASNYDETATHIAQNLQYNGDFELDADTEKYPKYWNRSIFGTLAQAQVRETDEASWPPWKPDGHVFYAYCDDAADRVLIKSKYFIPVSQDSYYCLSAWVKTQNSRCYLGIDWYDKDYVLLSFQYVCMSDYQATHDWEQKSSAAFKPSDYEATARYAKIRGYIQYERVGWTMISRIQFVESKTPVAWEVSYAVTPGADATDLSDFVAITYPADQSDLQGQIDGKIVSWFQVADPQPGWSGTDASHEGDMWWNTSTNQLKRWEGASWSSNIEDQKAIDAYADAATAQDTADGKRRVFTAQPTTPYDVGDLWSAGPSGDIKKCKTARGSGAYQAGDWELASEYTEGATWGSDITDQPDDALLLNELNCVGGYQEVSLPKEDGSPNCIDCYINNTSGAGGWFKIAEFNLVGTYKTCTWNGLFNYGRSDGRYTEQMRVRLSVQTDAAGALTSLGYQYSGDDNTAILKVGYVGTVVTVYASLTSWKSCLLDGAWSCSVLSGNSWIHTKQDHTDNIGSGTPAGTYLTPTKNYTLGADITVDNTANNANNYSGASIGTGHTDAKCTDANADRTIDHGQGWSWLTGSKPEQDADKTSTHDCQNPGDYTANHDCQHPGDYTAASPQSVDWLTVGTLTGSLVRTSSGNDRVELDATNNRLAIYRGGNLIGYLGKTASGRAIFINYPSGESYSPIYITSASRDVNVIQLVDTSVSAPSNYPSFHFKSFNDDKNTLYIKGDSSTPIPLVYLKQDGTADIIFASGGAKLTKAGVWTDASSVSLKENFEDFVALDLIKSLSIKRYNYISEKRQTEDEVRARLIRKRKRIHYENIHRDDENKPPQIPEEAIDAIVVEATELQEVEEELPRVYEKEINRTIPKHTSPMSEDLYAAFGIGDDKSISAKDLAGIALQAVKELTAKVEQLETQIAKYQGA